LPKRRRPLFARALVLAAGGLLWREKEGRFELAIVHRPGHGDWSLPKGKLERGEGFRRAALREVLEETGCRARILGYAGFTFYLVHRRPKLVVFFEMEKAGRSSFEPDDEVDEVAFLDPEEAATRLHYLSERRLVLRSRRRRER
jgi:8-oxo-dGTP pyrophosphatase MutT (NUDIX family)